MFVFFGLHVTTALVQSDDWHQHQISLNSLTDHSISNRHSVGVGITWKLRWTYTTTFSRLIARHVYAVQLQTLDGGTAPDIKSPTWRDKLSSTAIEYTKRHHTCGNQKHPSTWTSISSKRRYCFVRNFQRLPRRTFATKEQVLRVITNVCINGATFRFKCVIST